MIYNSGYLYTPGIPGRLRFFFDGSGVVESGIAGEVFF